MAITLKGTASGVVTSPTAVIPAPAGATAGDLVLLFVAFQSSWQGPATGYSQTWATLSPDPPDGWTRVTQEIHYPGDPDPALSLHAFHRFIGLGETQWPITFLGRTGYSIFYVAVAYAGVDPSTPIDVDGSGTTTPADNKIVAPSVTTTATNTRLVCAWLVPYDVGAGLVPELTTPAGMTLRAWVNTSGPWEPAGGLLVAAQAIAATGATGVREAAVHPDSVGVAASIALRRDQSQPTAQLTGEDVAIELGVPTARQLAVPTLVDEQLLDPDGALFSLVVELNPYDPVAEETVTTLVTDVALSVHPPETRELLLGGFSLTRSLLEDGALGGEGSVSAGSLQLAGGDGELDELAELAWDDHEMVGRIGGLAPPNDQQVPYASYREIIRARTQDPSGSLSPLEIPLTDRGVVLERKVQLNLYLGTGGLEGGEDLKGQPKPLGFGAVMNAEPRLLSRVPLRYQFHDAAGAGEPRALNRVYGGELEIPSSLWVPELDDGCFVLLANDGVAGRITCDFDGPELAGDTAASFFRFLISDYGIGPLVYPTDFVTDYFLIYEATQLAPLRLYLREETELRDALRRVVAPLGYWLWSRTGKILVGNVALPVGEPDYEVLEGEVRDLRRRRKQRPFSQITLGWGPNPTVMTDADMVQTAVGTERGLFALEAYRQVVWPEEVSEKLLEAYPTAKPKEMVETLFVDEADAMAAALEYWAIYGSPWRVFDLDTSMRPVLTDLGKVVRLAYQRWGLHGGVLFRYLAEDLQAPQGITMSLWRAEEPLS